MWEIFPSPPCKHIKHCPHTGGRNLVASKKLKVKFNLAILFLILIFKNLSKVSETDSHIGVGLGSYECPKCTAETVTLQEMPKLAYLQTIKRNPNSPTYNPSLMDPENGENPKY